MSKDISVVFVVSDDTDPQELYEWVRTQMEYKEAYASPKIYCVKMD